MQAIRFFFGLLFLLLFWNLSCAPSVKYTSHHTTKNRFQQSLLTEAERWVGTPYRYGGMDSSGIDCSGLVFRIYQRVYGKTLPRQARLQRKLGQSVSRRYLKPGDLLFFRFTGSGGINHVGIYLGDGRFIHASAKQGVVISSLNDRYYRRHLVVARRVLR